MQRKSSINSNYLLENDYNLTAVEISELRENFQKFDINGDGDIDIHELKRVMQLIGEAYDEESLRKTLNSASAKGHDKMTFQEFVTLVHQSKIVSVIFKFSIHKALLKSKY